MVFVEDVILPEQLLTQVAPETPEQRLMAAVLQEAIDNLRPNMFDRREHQRQSDRIALGKRKETARENAIRWVQEDEDPTWLFSFTNCCHVLGLEPESARAALLKRTKEASNG